MSKVAYKRLAIFCVIITAFGAIPEISRIMTSNAPDIAPQRTYLTIMVVSITCGILYLAFYFWRKGTKK
ncbi:hypothetical protein KORDIASMS9_04590 [Kordia sp. SMS9]|uniref:hypothetical protein n=1 Tax=Kordia sp. SMS9 TaxID=2282170 RepID=UPI000E0D8837|nr:hypothetical protein [Kordia sp. SMS9]AXG72319.1 hypothetical protein KORDIASMS9_04590 [Kordia sp. SMS9]